MTRKQRHLLTRIIVAAVLFLAGSLLHLPELAEMAVFLICYVVVGWDIVWKAITNILHPPTELSCPPSPAQCPDSHRWCFSLHRLFDW